MKENKRLISLFEKLYNGSPWIDINLMSVLEHITADKASVRIDPNCNTIWEITNHLICWRLNVLKRVQGNIMETPDNNYFESITDTSPQAWESTLAKFEDSQKLWLEFLKGIKFDRLEEHYPKNKMTYYEHIHGILQHDAYHLGQIVLMMKMIDLDN